MNGTCLAARYIRPRYLQIHLHLLHDKLESFCSNFSLPVLTAFAERLPVIISLPYLLNSVLQSDCQACLVFHVVTKVSLLLAYVSSLFSQVNVALAAFHTISPSSQNSRIAAYNLGIVSHKTYRVPNYTRLRECYLSNSLTAN